MGSNYRIIPVGGGGGTAPTGTLDVSQNGTYNVVGYKYVEVIVDHSPDYLCFTAEEDNSTILLYNGGGNTPNVEYSFDKVNWTTWDYSAITLANRGDKVYMRGDNPSGICHDSNAYSNFNMTGKIAASGNINSLIAKDVTTTNIPSACYLRLFDSCSSLTSVPYLGGAYQKAMVNSNSFGQTFRYCTGLTTLPSDLLKNIKEIKSFGLNETFDHCSNLTNIFIFPNTITYYRNTMPGLFQYCTSLETLDFSYITEFNDKFRIASHPFAYSGVKNIDLSNLNAIIWNDACENIFENCKDLVSISLPSLTRIAKNSSGGGVGQASASHLCEGCDNLESADLRNLTQVGSYGLYRAFRNCPKLKDVKIAVSTIDNPNNFGQWMENTAQSGDFYNLGNAQFPTGANGIPYNWTIHTTL